MNTFLDTLRKHTKTILLYGRLNDSFISSDLIMRDLETHLVMMLKSRGYKHIIFYGSDGNRGGYCLDPESARFFFNTNQGVSLPKLRNLDEDDYGKAATDSQADENAHIEQLNQPAEQARRTTVFDALRRGRQGGGYRPGDKPGIQSLQTVHVPQHLPTETLTQNSLARRVVYALRSWTLAEFFTSIQLHMLDPQSHMAVVFYNVINTNLGEHQALVDAIRHTWEQSSADNICLMLAQGTEESVIDLSNALRMARLYDKFAVDNNGHATLKTVTTFRFGPPEADEIRHLLHRLCVIGTSKGYRANIRYGELEKLAQEIIYCTRVDRQWNEYASLRTIYQTLEDYIDCHVRGKERVHLDTEVLDGIWNVHRDEEKSALECLDRPGWEEPYRVACELANRAHRRQREKQNKRSTPDHCTQRFSAERVPITGKNIDIPNFVLTGNPGTGKSEIARQIGRLLHELGFLPVGTTFEISPANMIDQYQGGVERMTLAACDQAEGGVLVIDEAESIATGNGSANPQANGKKMVETLNHSLTDPQRHFCLVLAGYRDGIEDVFKLDPGFRSRFEGHLIHIDDFGPSLLKDIFLESIHARNMELDASLLAPLPDAPEITPLDCMIERLYHQRNRRDFANAREMESLAKRVCDRVDLPGNVIKRRCFSPEITDDWFLPINLDNSLSAILRDFDSKLVGMQNVKDMIVERSLEVSEALARGVSIDSLSLRALMLVGNPGTGKTEVSKLLSRMYFGLGLLGTAEPIVVNASSLSSQYVGRGTEKMLEWVKEAQDRKALLFIDEAHQLSQHGMQEAFRALMAPLTDQEKPFQLVIAVYPQKLGELMDVDPGAISRFDRINLEDYTGEELYLIIRKMIDKQGLDLDEEIESTLHRVCDQIYATRTDETGNGRAMAKLLEEMNKRRRVRCERQGLAYGIPESLRFTREDIPPEIMDKLPDEDRNAEEICEEILAEIESNYVGMEEIREFIRDLASEVAETEARGGQTMTIPVPAIVLSGNPGAGKTLAADILTKAMYRLRLISTPEKQVCSGQSLLGSYMNESGRLAREAISRAWKANALLFVDEAHQLANEHSNGSESIQSFMQPLTAEGRRPRVVFAVYKNRENAFMRLDPGMSQRMRVFHLPDFDAQQLLNIFTKKAKQSGWEITEQASRILFEHCKRLYNARSEDSGNGRQVERLLDNVVAQHRRRCRLVGISTKDTEYWALSEEDLPENVSRSVSLSSRDDEIHRLQAIRERMHAARVGNEGVMKILDNHIDYLIYNLRYPSRKQEVEPGHYFFVGHAGTGKTTAAEFMAMYMHEIGVVNSGELYKTTAADLIGQYLGETSHKTREALMAGRGHVMLIDEAYALSDKDGQATSYKDDAITEIVSFLDDEHLRRVTCVIFAGYKEDMDRLYKRNEGLKSRVKAVLFPDFTLEQCLQLFESMAAQSNYEIAVEARERITECLTILMKRPGFSNGRTVRRLCSAICARAMNRVLENLYVEDDPRVSMLLSEDVPTDSEALQIVNL